MNDIQALLSGNLHIQRILFTVIVTRNRNEIQTSHYLGSASRGRFFLISMPSSLEPDYPLEMWDEGWVYGRGNQTDFVKNSDLPVIVIRPRSEPQAQLDRSFASIYETLQNCLQLGLGAWLVKPGSFRWDSDRFTAEYAEHPDSKIEARFGKTLSEDEKEQILAKMLANPIDWNRETAYANLLVEAEHSVNTGTELPEGFEDPPGALDLKLMEHAKAQNDAVIKRGIRGYLLRDAHGVSGIQLEASVPLLRIEFEYAPALNLPSPFPHRIRAFTNVVNAERQPVPPLNTSFIR